jgi:hypothetical protein
MPNSLSGLHNHHDKLDGINPCKLCDVHSLCFTACLQYK